MSAVKKIAEIALVIVLATGSFFAGRHSVKIPHVLVLDPKTSQFVPLVAPDNAKIFVASPDGFEPGVYAAHSKDGSQILILPPSLIPSKDDQAPQQSEPQAKHTEPEQSGGERLDRASL